MTGAPIANANVALWESYYENSKWHWRRLRQTTNSDGLAPFALKVGDRLSAACLSLAAEQRVGRHLPPAMSNRQQRR